MKQGKVTNLCNMTDGSEYILVFLLLISVILGMAFSLLNKL